MKHIAVLFAIFLAIALFVYFYEYRGQEVREEAEKLEESLLRLKQDEIRSVEISRPDKDAIRIQKGIEEADLVVVRFGEKYKQWNAAFDAGYATALKIPIVTLHDKVLSHPLKEVDAAAHATAETPEQIVELLKYLLTQQ